MSAAFGRYRVALDARGEKSDYTVGTWGGPEKAVRSPFWNTSIASARSPSRR